MTVYLVFSYVQYEGATLRGIFATRDLAERALEHCNQDRYVGYEYFGIVESVVSDSYDGDELGYIS